MVWEILLFVFILWLIIRKWQRRKLTKLANQLKSSFISLPLIGHSYLLIGNNEDRMKAFQMMGRDAIRRDGVISIWHSNTLFIVIADPEVAEFVLKNCLEKDDLIATVTNVLIGNGSIFAPVSLWRPRRKILAPTFSSKNLRQFMQTFTRQNTIMVDHLSEVAGREAFSIWKYITPCTMDSVCETTLGVQVQAQKSSNHPFLKSLDELFKMGASRVCQPWIHSDSIYKNLPTYKLALKHKDVVLNFISKIIKDKRESMSNRKKVDIDDNSSLHVNKLKTFLELLIESSGGDKGFTDCELQEETLVLVMAGTDTSAVGIAFTTVILASHPDVQDKVYEELQEVFGDSSKPIDPEDLPRLKYLDAVLRETLRLYPPVPIIIRKVDKNLEMPSGVTLIKGCSLLVNIWAINRNPQYWGDDADDFKPERFFDMSPKHPAAFLTFSNGARSCAGYKYAMMSMKTSLAILLRRYRVLPDKEIADPIPSVHVPLRVKFDLIMRHLDDYFVRLEPRA